MQTRKLFTVALALCCVMSFAFILSADGSDAAAGDITKQAEPEWGGFTDMKDGHFTVFLTNNTDGELNVKVVVYDGESNKEKDSTTKTVAAHTDESFRMGFGYGSDGTKMVYYKVFTVDADYNETLCFQEGNFDIHVSHSMWKNTSTYVTIVIIVLVVVVIVVIFMRSRTKKVVGGGKSFTELEAERKAKKTNKVAQKQTYKAGEKKSRK